MSRHIHHAQQHAQVNLRPPRMVNASSPGIRINNDPRPALSHSPQSRKSNSTSLVSSSSSPCSSAMSLPSTSGHAGSGAIHPPSCLKLVPTTNQRPPPHVKKLTRTVHFPPSPLGPVSHTFQTHSAETYDRTPIHSRSHSRPRHRVEEEPCHEESRDDHDTGPSSYSCSCSRSSCRGDDDSSVAVAISFVNVALCLSIISKAWAWWGLSGSVIVLFNSFFLDTSIRDPLFPPL